MIYLWKFTRIFEEAERTDTQFPSVGNKGKMDTKMQIQVKIEQPSIMSQDEKLNGYRGKVSSFKVYF